MRRPPFFALVAVVASCAPQAVAVETFSAPSGNLGGDLSLDPAQRSRLHAEMSYFTSTNLVTSHSLVWKFGAGVKLSDQVELQLEVPVAGAILVADATTVDFFGAGNVALGANYFRAFGRALRLKLGGTVAFGPWNDSDGDLTTEGDVIAAAGRATHGYQELWLFEPGTVHLVAPARVEIGETLQFTGDFIAHLLLPTIGGDVNAVVTLAPGIAVWPVPQWTFGARLPVQFLTTNPRAPTLSPALAFTDEAQIGLEPFIRFNFGEHAYVSTRLSLHLDDDLGFSFDSGGVWGWHLGLGGAF